MEPNLFAAIGGLAIGLIAGVVGSFGSIRKAQPGTERRYVLLWSAAFPLALATFMGGLPLVSSPYRWLMVCPLVLIPVAVAAVNRAPAKFRKRVEGTNG
jgi:uncharacterized membrane protein